MTNKKWMENTSFGRDSNVIWISCSSFSFTHESPRTWIARYIRLRSCLITYYYCILFLPSPPTRAPTFLRWATDITPMKRSCLTCRLWRSLRFGYSAAHQFILNNFHLGAVDRVGNNACNYREFAFISVWKVLTMKGFVLLTLSAFIVPGKTSLSLRVNKWRLSCIILVCY